MLLVQWCYKHVLDCLRCAWNQIDSDYIVSTSSDCTAAVSRLSGGGKVVRRYGHPAPVFGCDWHRADRDRFVTGCDDGIVRVFDKTKDGALMALHGHTAKVFNTIWSPLLPEMILTGSDDRWSHGSQLQSLWTIPSAVAS